MQVIFENEDEESISKRIDLIDVIIYAGGLADI